MNFCIIQICNNYSDLQNNEELTQRTTKLYRGQATDAGANL